jgi:hypothetical protein
VGCRMFYLAASFRTQRNIGTPTIL